MVPLALGLCRLSGVDVLTSRPELADGGEAARPPFVGDIGRFGGDPGTASGAVAVDVGPADVELEGRIPAASISARSSSVIITSARVVISFMSDISPILKIRIEKNFTIPAT